MMFNVSCSTNVNSLVDVGTEYRRADHKSVVLLSFSPPKTRVLIPLVSSYGKAYHVLLQFTDGLQFSSISFLFCLIKQATQNF